ncbi:MAG: hypothetical protein WD269_06550 [Acidimicrobiia bacterium]
MSWDGWRVVIICVGAAAVIAGGLRGDAAEETATIRLPVTIESESRLANRATIVEVERGDHLWKISERRLDDVLGREPADTEITPYWRQVIEVNRAGLRSGNPDLIFPGEVITLPGGG